MSRMSGQELTADAFPTGTEPRVIRLRSRTVRVDSGGDVRKQNKCGLGKTAGKKQPDGAPSQPRKRCGGGAEAVGEPEQKRQKPAEMEQEEEEEAEVVATVGGQEEETEDASPKDAALSVGGMEQVEQEERPVVEELQEPSIQIGDFSVPSGFWANLSGLLQLSMRQLLQVGAQEAAAAGVFGDSQEGGGGGEQVQAGGTSTVLLDDDLAAWLAGAPLVQGGGEGGEEQTPGPVSGGGEAEQEQEQPSSASAAENQAMQSGAGGMEQETEQELRPASAGEKMEQDQEQASGAPEDQLAGVGDGEQGETGGESAAALGRFDHACSVLVGMPSEYHSRHREFVVAFFAPLMGAMCGIYDYLDFRVLVVMKNAGCVDCLEEMASSHDVSMERLLALPRQQRKTIHRYFRTSTNLL